MTDIQFHVKMSLRKFRTRLSIYTNFSFSFRLLELHKERTVTSEKNNWVNKTIVSFMMVHVDLINSKSNVKYITVPFDNF